MIFFFLSRDVKYVTMPITALFISLEQICRKLETICLVLNHMILDSGKCHYIVTGDADFSQKIVLINNEISSSDEEKLLGILLDSKLNFDSHITSLCKKVDQKRSGLSRINWQLLTSLHFEKSFYCLMSSVAASQFSYYCSEVFKHYNVHIIEQ